MKRYLRLFALILCFLSVFACRKAGIPTNLGFRIDPGAEIGVQIPQANAAPHERSVQITHKGKPTCLFGEIHSFGDVKLKDYLKGINNETDISGKIPYLERFAQYEEHGILRLARVRVYNGEESRYKDAVLGVFRTDKELWATFIHLGCADQRYETLARTLLLSISAD